MLSAIVGALVAVGLVVGIGQASAVSDSGTVNVIVQNRNSSVVDAQTTLGAFVSYFGDSDTTFGASGTGVFDPFVRLQGSPSEQGYNTNGTTEFDTKVGTWTHAILVSHIPQRPCPTVNPSPPPAVGSETCFELFVDINENNSTPYVSLNKVQVYYSDNPNLTGYSTFSTSPPAGTSQVYAFNGDILIHDVNQGSGRGDLRYDIPINGSNGVGLPPNCDYLNPSCNTYFVLYSQWGTSPSSISPSHDYTSDGGFEEWQVRIYPVSAIQILKETTKTGNALVANPGAVFSITGPGGYSATVTDNGSGDSDSTVGSVCISGLQPGTYTVNETTPPSGYGAASQTNVTATAVDGTNCTTNKPTTANSAVFTDPPLSKIYLGWHSLAGTGATTATIQCTGEATASAFTDGGSTPTITKTLGNGTTTLVPGSYSCTIVIDP